MGNRILTDISKLLWYYNRRGMLQQQQQRVVRVDRVITRLLRYVTSVCWCADTDRQTDSQSVAHSILTYYTDDSVAIVCLFVCHIQLRLNTTVNKLVCIDLVVVVSIRSMQMRAPISWLPNLCTRAFIEYIYVGAFCFKMLPSVKFAEDKVLTFLILREKC